MGDFAKKKSLMIAAVLSVAIIVAFRFGRGSAESERPSSAPSESSAQVSSANSGSTKIVSKSSPVESKLVKVIPAATPSESPMRRFGCSAEREVWCRGLEVGEESVDGTFDAKRAREYWQVTLQEGEDVQIAAYRKLQEEIRGKDRDLDEIILARQIYLLERLPDARKRGLSEDSLLTEMVSLQEKVRPVLSSDGQATRFTETPPEVSPGAPH